ncbi:MAG: sugar-binding protein [Planctomycetota bacterium]
MATQQNKGGAMKFHYLGLAALVALGLAAIGRAVEAPVADKMPLPTVAPVKFTEAPKLDGQLDDACWKQAAKIELNHLLGSTSMPTVKTEGWLGYDAENLYIAVRCGDAKGQKIVAAREPARRAGRAGQYDSIEIFLNPAGKGYRYSHFVLGAGNVSREQMVTGKDANARDGNWSVPWRSATQVKDGEWTAELAIPLFVLGRPTVPERIPFNIVRNKKTEPQQNITWAPVGGSGASGGYHDPDHFGIITGFKGLTIPAVCAPVLLQAGEVGPFTRKDDGSQYYTFKVRIGNQGGLAGETELEIEDQTRDGAVTRHREKVAVPMLGMKASEVAIPVAYPADRAAKVILASEEKGPGAWWMPVAGTEGLTPLIMYPNLSLYSGEPTGRLIVGMAFDDEGFKAGKMRLNVEVNNSTGKKVLKEQYREIRNQGVVVEMPVGKWEAGTYTGRVELLNADKKTIASLETIIRVAPPPPAGVTVSKVDHERICVLVNGKPFFPFGFLTADISAGKAEGYAREGFNLLVDWDGWRLAVNGVPWTEALEKRLNELLDQKIKVYQAGYAKGVYSIANTVGMIGWGHNYDWEHNFQDHPMVLEKLPLIINKLKTQPGIIAWEGLDEPESGRFVTLMREHREKIRECDPYRIMWSTARGLTPDMLGAYDVYGGHAYYSPDEGPRRLGWLIYSMVKTAKMGRTPVWATPQNQDIGAWFRRELTPDERRCGIYLALINGAKGVHFFADSGTPHPMIRRILAYTAREVAMIAPIIMEQAPPQNVQETLVDSTQPAVVPPLPRPRTLYDPSEPVRMSWGGEIPLPLVQALIQDKPDGGDLILIANSGNEPVTVNCALSSFAKATEGKSSPGGGKLGSRPDVGRLSESARRVGDPAYNSQGPNPPHDQPQVKDFFSGRDYPVKDGQFTIEFEPYGVRVLETFGSLRKKGEPVALGLTVIKPKEADLAGENMVKNGGFEEGEWQEGKDGSSSLSPWGFFRGRIVTNEFHSGRRALCLEATSNMPACTSYKIPLNPNTRYRFSLWAKEDFTSYVNRPGYNFIIVAGKINHVSARGHEPSPQWKEYTTTVATQDQPATADVYVVVSPGTVGAVYVDDVMVEDLNAKKQFIKLEDRRVTHEGYAKQESQWIYSKVDSLEQTVADEAARPGENLLRNSSFEEYVVPPMPDCWPLGFGYIRTGRGQGTNAYDGKYSLELWPSRSDRPNVGYMFWSNWEHGRTYTLSAYVRAETAGCAVRLNAYPWDQSYDFINSPKLLKSPEFTVGTEWQRVEWTFQPISTGAGRWSGPVSIGIFYSVLPGGEQGKGPHIWVDAVQLELGDKATEYKRDSYRAPYVDPKWLSDEVFKELEKRKTRY